MKTLFLASLKLPFYSEVGLFLTMLSGFMSFAIKSAMTRYHCVSLFFVIRHVTKKSTASGLLRVYNTGLIGTSTCYITYINTYIQYIQSGTV